VSGVVVFADVAASRPHVACCAYTWQEERAPHPRAGDSAVADMERRVGVVVRQLMTEEMRLVRAAAEQSLDNMFA
jgi:hypothetical protein